MAPVSFSRSIASFERQGSILGRLMSECRPSHRQCHDAGALLEKYLQEGIPLNELQLNSMLMSNFDHMNYR